MDSRRQSDSDGGGGHHGSSLPSTGLPGTQHDEGRPQSRLLLNHNSPTDPWFSLQVLALDQIRITGSSNEYTEGPTVAPALQHRQQKNDLVLSSPRTSIQQGTWEESSNNFHNMLGNTNTSNSSTEGMLHSPSVEDSQSSTRTCVGSTLSGPRLLGTPLSADQIIRMQPKRAKLNSEELKPLTEEPRVVAAIPGSGSCRNGDIHSKCEDCGRCRCSECNRTRVLPSCWMCGRRCVCSVQNTVEYGTCVCCVKGLFYHCSSDDEDTCTDKPFSCTQAYCCMRWTTVSLLSMLLPCLLCYLPAKGCVAVCQSCYDRVSRPGCRCKNTNPIHCEAVGKPT